MEANVYSGDPNRVRDRSKDYDVTVDGIVVAVIYGDTNPPQVVWRVYGPQDAPMAVKVADAIGKAAQAALAGVRPEDKAPPVQAPAKKRNYTHAIREEIAAGKSDDEIWAVLQPELDLRNDQRYRIKEVRKELAKAAEAPVKQVEENSQMSGWDKHTPDPWIEKMLDNDGVKPGPVDLVAAREGVGKTTLSPTLESLLNS